LADGVEMDEGGDDADIDGGEGGGLGGEGGAEGDGFGARQIHFPITGDEGLAHNDESLSIQVREKMGHYPCWRGKMEGADGVVVYCR